MLQFKVRVYITPADIIELRKDTSRTAKIRKEGYLLNRHTSRDLLKLMIGLLNYYYLIGTDLGRALLESMLPAVVTQTDHQAIIPSADHEEI